MSSSIKFQIAICFILIVVCIVVYTVFACCPSWSVVKEYFAHKKEKFNCSESIKTVLINDKSCQNVFIKNNNKENISLINLFAENIIGKDLQDKTIHNQENNIIMEIKQFINSKQINNPDMFKDFCKQYKNKYNLVYVKI